MVKGFALGVGLEIVEAWESVAGSAFCLHVVCTKNGMSLSF